MKKVALTVTCCSNPVIYGVMDVDWHYYLLIAPHSNSSSFEDQSGRVPLCVPTLIKTNKANCSLCTSVCPDPFPALQVQIDAHGESPIQEFTKTARNKCRNREVILCLSTCELSDRTNEIDADYLTEGRFWQLLFERQQ